MLALTRSTCITHRSIAAPLEPSAKTRGAPSFPGRPFRTPLKGGHRASLPGKHIQNRFSEQFWCYGARISNFQRNLLKLGDKLHLKVIKNTYWGNGPEKNNSCISAPGPEQIFKFLLRKCADRARGSWEALCERSGAAAPPGTHHCCPYDCPATVATLRGAFTRRAACRAVVELLKTAVSVTKL